MINLKQNDYQGRPESQQIERLDKLNAKWQEELEKRKALKKKDQLDPEEEQQEQDNLDKEVTGRNEDDNFFM